MRSKPITTEYEYHLYGSDEVVRREVKGTNKPKTEMPLREMTNLILKDYTFHCRESALMALDYTDMFFRNNSEKIYELKGGDFKMKPKVKTTQSGGKGKLKEGGKAPINEKAAPKNIDKRMK
jgi:hypothetical protein